MELRKGTAPQVKFYDPTPDTTIENVSYVVDGGEVVNATFTTTDDTHTLQLPYLQGNSVEVTWQFSIDSVPEQTFEEVYSYEVITPYLTDREVKEIWPQATDAQVVAVESAVRHIINAHCGQSFGLSKNKSVTVEGHGETALRLPERLVRITGLSTLTARLDPNVAIIVSDGWFIKKGWSQEIERLETDNVYFEGGHVTQGVFLPEKANHGEVIKNPRAVTSPTTWQDDYPFTITGDWGYESVPAQVKEAAKLLINDYACSESQYRDRYLDSIRAADWRLEFNGQAWQYTGNVRADQLLAEYVLLDWAVV